jgi:hypothetical protein
MISDLDNIGVLFTISYVLVASLNTSNFVLSQTMLTRVLKDESRATILSFQGLVGSVAMIAQG